MAREVVWSPRASQQLRKAYEYIGRDSLKNAEKVRIDILESTKRLPNYPEIHSQDKYRKNNNGNFRAYELHHYRIAYQITPDKIIIVRVRHTKMEPKQY